MGAPQGPEEVARWVAELQSAVNDDALDIRWNPVAVTVQRPSYNGIGQLTPGVYDGLWEVIRYGGETTRPTAQRGDPVIVYQVRNEHDRYKPLGEWLVHLFREWNTANARAHDRLREMLADDERQEQSAEHTAADAFRESLDYAHHVGVGPLGHWQGRGMDVNAAGDIIRSTTTTPGGQSARISPE